MPSVRNSFLRTHLTKTLKLFYDFLDAAPTFLNGRVAVTTVHASSTTLPVNFQRVDLTTSNAGADAVALPNPATTGEPGWRVCLKLVAKPGAGDSVTVGFANISTGSLTISAVVLDAVGEYLLLEHRGAKWEVISASAGVVTAA